MPSESSRPSVYGTGLIALDIILGTDAKLPVNQWAGGTCGNVLAILSYLGWNSYPIARLNTTASSVRVKKDLQRWGVRLDFAHLRPTSTVPVITQEIYRDKQGAPAHRFHWRNCPRCGAWLPNYKAVTLGATRNVKEQAKSNCVFFFDRVSPGALDLAHHFKQLGGIVFFEPSAKDTKNRFEKALFLADIVKYSEQRFPRSLIDRRRMEPPMLEVQTLGAQGLRYRTASMKSWCHLDACKPHSVKDTSGSGDWTAAGIIDRLCRPGKKVLGNYPNATIEAALKYGQALGAWNCNFEGPRAGMYQVTKGTFNRQVESILSGVVWPKGSKVPGAKLGSAKAGHCPACP